MATGGPSFAFHLPTRIHVGEGLLSETGRLTRGLFGRPGAGDAGRPVATRRALLVTDPGVRRAGLTDLVRQSLEEAGFVCECFDGIEPNPKDRDCEAGAAVARVFGPEVIVAVGGGSVLDAAKVIALLNTHPGRVGDYEGRGKVTGEVTPLVAIPTTAGTGSEVTRSAVITDTVRNFKFTVKDVRLAPALAVVDPLTTHALPRDITASTGMDALVHAVEAYTSRPANPMSDTLAAAAMERIFPALRAVVADGRNHLARYDMMVGSTLAGLAFSHSDVGAVHCLAEALGGLYDTPHGVANSIFFPAVTAFNAQADPAKHARAAAACGLPVAGLSPEEATTALVEAIRDLARDIGIPAFASLPRVRPADFDRLAEASFANGSTPSNCRPITQEDYLRLLGESWAVGPGRRPR